MARNKKYLLEVDTDSTADEDEEPSEQTLQLGTIILFLHTARICTDMAKVWQECMA
jgi:hypothetical protein